MSAMKKKETAAQATENEKRADVDAASASTESGEKSCKQEDQNKAFLAKLPDPCVYCGPSVRGVARQYTVYNGGIPDALKEFIREHRTAKGLIVGVERFSEMRKRLETPGTAEFILFRRVRAEL